MSENSNIQRLKPDAWLGGFLTVVGLWAAHEATSFDEFSWIYPFTLSAALAVLGAAIGLRAFKAGHNNRPMGDARVFLQGAVAMTVALALWVVALDHGLGYVGPTFVAVVALLWIIGIRDRKRLLVNGLGVTVGVFVLFGIIFATPLPVLEPLQILIRQ